MTYSEKEASLRQVTLTQEEREYLLKLMELDLKYHTLLGRHSKVSAKSRAHLLFLCTLQEKLSA